MNVLYLNLKLNEKKEKGSVSLLSKGFSIDFKHLKPARTDVTPLKAIQVDLTAERL